jgi:two-component system, OmpR family, response regulator
MGEDDWMKIFVVDDSEVVTTMVSRYLSACGYEVETSNSPFGASNRIRESAPHVLLMDLGLPGLSGENLLSICRKNGGQGPRVILISSSEEKMRAVVHRGLADDYFVKGSPLHDLEAKIRRLFPPSVVSSFLSAVAG